MGGRSAHAPAAPRVRIGNAFLAAISIAVLALICAAPALAGDPVLTDDGTFHDHSGRKQAPGRAPSLLVRGTETSAAVRFDLSMLPGSPTGSQVAKATLKMWINRVESPGTLSVLRVGNDWNEKDLGVDSGLTPAGIVAQGIEIGDDSERNFLLVDVTQAVRDWLDGTAANFGLALTGTSPKLRIAFDSKENVAGGHEPELIVDLSWGESYGSNGTQFLLGPQGPQGPQGPPGADGPAGPSGTSINPLRIARLRTYTSLGTGYTTPAGPGPAGIAFDGGNIWVANRNTNTISRHRMVDGVKNADATVGTAPAALAYDGANVWAANSGSNTVTRVRIYDWWPIGTANVGSNPTAITFDGTNMWVVNTGSDNVTRLKGSDMSLLGTIPVGTDPAGACSDATSVWITNSGDGTVTRLSIADGSLIGTYPAGTAPHGIAFDGTDMWITDTASGNVLKLSGADGSLLGTYPVGASPLGIVFDGEMIWVVNSGDGTVSILNVSDGSLIQTRNVGSGPEGIAFDGVHLWVTNYLSGTLSKL